MLSQLWSIFYIDFLDLWNPSIAADCKPQGTGCSQFHGNFHPDGVA